MPGTTLQLLPPHNQVWEPPPFQLSSPHNQVWELPPFQRRCPLAPLRRSLENSLRRRLLRCVAGAAAQFPAHLAASEHCFKRALRGNVCRHHFVNVSLLIIFTCSMKHLITAQILFILLRKVKCNVIVSYLNILNKKNQICT